ncbi:MAG: hypothetical protein WCI72_06790 [archaeon]
MEKKIRTANGMDFIVSGEEGTVNEVESEVNGSSNKEFDFASAERFGKDTYELGQHNKVIDFFMGFFMYIGLYIALSSISYIFSLSFSSVLGHFSLIGIFASIFGLFGLALWVLPLLISLYIAKSRLVGRRLVRVGVWVAFFLPFIILLLLFGMCLVALGGI